MYNSPSVSANSNPPRLAPPGAGLPPLEQFFAKLLVQWQSRRVSRESAAELFSSELRHIRELVAATPSEQRKLPALIKRLPGLEDSSRYWSVLMTLDHLQIVNGQLAGVITQLASGHTPPGAASTAAVKPDPEVGEEVIDAFDTTSQALVDTVKRLPTLKGSATFPHPWFGPLNASGWHFMAAFHMRLHRRQIQLILQQLARG